MPARTRALICARCLDHHFLLQSFCVNASQEEGACLETPDGTRHPIGGSSSLGCTADHATTTAAGLSTIARTRLALRNFKIGADHFGRDEATSFWSQRWAGRFVRENRTRLVLKPNDGYGGHGVYFGPQLDERAWENAIATALSSDYVVQEAVDLSPRGVSNLQPDRMETSANVR